MAIQKDSNQPGPTAAASSTTSSTTTASPVGGGGLVLLGLGVAGLGALLAIGPGLAPGIQPWAATLAKHGATPALVGATGVLVAAIGLATRAITRRSREVWDALTHLPSPDGRIDALGSELAQVRGALQELRVESVYLRDGIAGLQQGLGEELSSGHRQGLQEAVFQMAGSLDQMGARLEERMALQHDVFAQALQTFHNSLLMACLRIDELHGRMGQVAPARETGIAPARPDSLGVLDLLDDPPAPMPHAAPRMAVHAPNLAATGIHPAPALPAQVIVDPAVASTAAYLQNLFTDERVRAAFTHLQNTGAI